MVEKAMELCDLLKTAADECGVDLFGVAPIERFAGVAAEHHPASIFPECRNVIALGKRITRGCLRGTEEGSSTSIYNTYGVNWVPNRFLALMTVTLASILEDKGYEASPVQDLPVETPAMGVAVAPDRPAPNVMIDVSDAAVRAGLGEIGLSGELMTPQFGHLQRIQLILTDAELPATPLFEGKICDACGLCAKACPFDAIDADAAREVDIAGKVCTVAPIDNAACNACRNGARTNPSHPAGQADRKAAVCMRTCIDRLWAEGKLSKNFSQRFRQRPAWFIGRSGVSELQSEVRS